MGMNKRKNIMVVLLGIFIIFNLCVSGASAQGKEKRRQGPPPEAYTVCEGKYAGDTAEFVSPHGDTVTGTCLEDDDNRLVLRPDNPPDGQGPDKPND
jgi:hypothetical protein